MTEAKQVLHIWRTSADGRMQASSDASLCLAKEEAKKL